MKKFLSFIMVFCLVIILAGCGKGESAHAIELMGAGDRIHDSYTFANVGTKIGNQGNGLYEIFGSVEKLENEAVKKEFKIAEDVSHVVAIKLTAIKTKVEKDKVQITTNGNRAYDAEHINGTNYTFIILEAKPGTAVTISVKWNETDDEKNYTVKFNENLLLK